MICLKCGKETQEKQAFCDSCLAVMATCPVKPDVRITLPKHAEEAVVGKSARRKKAIPYEEQVEHLKLKNRRLRILCLVLLLAFGLCAAGLVQRILLTPDTTDSGAVTGQNYTYAEEQ